MPSFYPETTIYACSTGIDDYNKPYFESNSAAASYCMSRAKLSFSDYSYQRADERQYCAVYANFNDLEECDTLIWQNADFSNFWFIANITNLEWKNPNCVWVWFKIDAFMTFCGNIDWSNSYCLVEREHVTNDWSGSTPQFWNMGVPEGIGIGPETQWTRTTRYLTPNRIVITSPYDQSGSPTISGLMRNNVYTGLNSIEFTGSGAANSYLTTVANNPEADIANVVSIQTIPSEFLDGQTQTVDAPTPPWNSFQDVNNAKCWSGEFCQLRISSLCGQDKFYNPEFFLSPNSITFNEIDTYAGGVGGILLRPNSYMNSQGAEDSFVMTEYPAGVAIGDAYAQWLNTTGQYVTVNAAMGVMSAIGNAIGGIGSAVQDKDLTRGIQSGVNAVAQGVNAVNSAQQAFAQAKANGSIMLGSSAANANFAAGVGAYGYAISWVMPSQPNLYGIDDYFSRFGYRVNRLKIPNRNTRPHWNYVKCYEAHVQGDMPYRYRMDINAMLTSGVTFWNEGTTIGDFSDARGNRG